MQYLLVCVYLLFTTSGLVFMKLGNNAGTLGMSNGNISFSMNIISMIGFVLYIVSFLLFTKIITTYDLSFILPIITGIVQILSLLAAIFIFKEQVTVQGFIGIALVITGIIIMNLKNK